MSPPPKQNNGSTQDRPAAWAEGWVPLFRAVLDGPVRSEPLTLWVYVELASRARYHAGCMRTPGHATYVECDIGQAVFGRKELASRAHVGQTAIRTALQRLVKWDMIRLEPTNLGTTVTICGYKEWWTKEESKKPATGSTANQAATSARPQTDTRTQEHQKYGETDSDRVSGPGGPDGLSNQLSASLAERHEDQKLAAQVHAIRVKWQQTSGRQAGFDYVLDGLNRSDDPIGVADHLALLCCGCTA